MKIIIAVIFSLVTAQLNAGTRTFTRTYTNTATITKTATPSPTNTPSPTISQTFSQSQTFTNSPTPTSTVTATQTPNDTDTDLDYQRQIPLLARYRLKSKERVDTVICDNCAPAVGTATPVPTATQPISLNALATVVAMQATQVAAVATAQTVMNAAFQIGPVCQTCTAHVAIYAMPALEPTSQTIKAAGYWSDGTPIPTRIPVINSDTAPALVATPLAGVQANTAPGLLATPLAGVQANTAPGLLATPLAGVQANTAPGLLATPLAGMSAKLPPALGPQAQSQSLAVNPISLTMTGASISIGGQSDVFDIMGLSNISVELVGSSWVDGGGSKILFYTSNDNVTWTLQGPYQAGAHQVNGINASSYNGVTLDFPFAGNHRYFSVSCTAITSGSFVPWLVAGASGNVPQQVPDTFNLAGVSKSNGTGGIGVLAAQAQYSNNDNNNDFVRDSTSLKAAWVGTSCATSSIMYTPAASSKYHVNYMYLTFDVSGAYTIFDSAGTTLTSFNAIAGTPYVWRPQNDIFGPTNNNTVNILGPGSSHYWGNGGFDKH